MTSYNEFPPLVEIDLSDEDLEVEEIEFSEDWELEAIDLTE